MGLVWNAVGKEYGKRKGVFPLVFLGTRKFEEKYKRNKIERKSKRKIKNKFKFKFNILFLYISSNSFYLFLSIIIKLNNLKIYKF